MNDKVEMLETAIAERWERIARLDGWTDAYDYDEELLVVFHEGKAHHYTGADAWRLAALHEDCPCCRAAQV